MKNIILIMVCVLVAAANVEAATFLSFDNFSTSTGSTLPKGDSTWHYNPNVAYGSSTTVAGFETTAAPISDRFYRFNNTYNDEHMGYEAYGYLDIDNTKAVSGKSLRWVFTGGRNTSPCTTPTSCGTPLFNKETYLSEVAAGRNPVASGVTVGTPYLYFYNTGDHSSVGAQTPLSFAPANASKLSFYMYIPAGVTVGTGGYGVPVMDTIGAGPANKVIRSSVFPGGDSSYVGGHWYHQWSLEGGGWAKVYADTHPEHNNGFSNVASYPYPSSSIRSIGPTYFSTMFDFYVNMGSYEGIAQTPYSVWFDEFEFTTDTEAQNNETLNNPGIIRNDTTGYFEVSFKDKYKNLGYSGGTYELRYSTSPITNANFNSATPVHVLADTRFNAQDNINGAIYKWWSGYLAVWARFKLQDSDHAAISNGQTIYFALKDKSQVGGNSLDPVAGLSGLGGGGRDYRNHPTDFDYAADQPAMLLIKSFDYTVTLPTADPTPPTTTANKSGRYTASQTVTLSVTESATTKYCLTAGCTPGTTYSAPFKVLQNIATQTLRYQSTDTANNVEAVQEVVLRKQKKK